MHRTQIILDDWQYEVLKNISARDGRSISFIVREAVASYLTKDQRKAQKRLRQIEGIAEDRESRGRDHDRYLYGKEHRSAGSD